MFCWIPEGAAAEKPVSAPADLSDEPLQSPQVASDHEIAGAVQIAGKVVKYDNIGFQLNHPHLQNDVQQLLIRSRRDHKGKYINCLM